MGLSHGIRDRDRIRNRNRVRLRDRDMVHFRSVWTLRGEKGKG